MGGYNGYNTLHVTANINGINVHVQIQHINLNTWT